MISFVKTQKSYSLLQYYLMSQDRPLFFFFFHFPSYKCKLDNFSSYTRIPSLCRFTLWLRISGLENWQERKSGEKMALKVNLIDLFYIQITIILTVNCMCIYNEVRVLETSVRY